ncbi:replication factor C large subunit [Catovirus CTV1]|uniref:Replication factor C large subunit n=1 Tax=Catovirus CTV1 TaxID=1977631 RepID=A0A1V0SC86_9VIRU|nr:replication factor C large subunit [Catovirus CTV1]
METIDPTNKKTSTSWTDKYAPKKISEIIGNYKAINGICAWLKSFDKNKKDAIKKNKDSKSAKRKKRVIKSKLVIDTLVDEDNTDDNDLTLVDDVDENDMTISKKKTKKREGPFSCLLVTGNHGVGKTCSVHTILHELGYKIQTINFSRIQKAENMKDLIDRLTNTTDVMDMIEERTKVKSALVVDEVESLVSKLEIGCVMALIESNDLRWHYPIIFISNNQHNKFINEIKKKSHEIMMWQPFPDTMMILLNKIREKEKIVLQDRMVCNKIVEHSQKDFRRLVTILQDIKYVYENKTITHQIINEYCNLAKRKDIDYDLFKASSNIIHQYMGIDDTLRYHETDKVNLPLMMQENYIKSINMETDKLKKYNTAKDITLSLSKGDVIENYIYGNQNWSIHEVHGFYACVYPSYLINSISNSDEPKNFRLDFPSDLNRTSIKKINKKNILKVNEFLKNMNIKDYVYINQLMRNLIEDNRISECTDLFEGYNLSLENIDKLLKVDKIKSTKINLTSKQKKEITKNLNPT